LDTTSILTIIPLDMSASLPTIKAMHTRSSKRPRDANQLAKHIVDIATAEADVPYALEQEKNPAAVELGRWGAAKAGKHEQVS
jgi:hypothetical protein